MPVTINELMVSLWAGYDASVGCAYGLAGQAYAIEGTDQHKLAA